jgi:sugar phosphate isomerase/epimerase
MMFTLGTTSYIYPADIAANVRKLAGKVGDVELVIFELKHEGNIPDEKVMEELIHVGNEHGMTYTVHLPLDLELGGDQPAIMKALKVIDRTAPLKPAGYVVHLDGFLAGGESERAERSLATLNILSEAVPDPRLLCIENLETEDPVFIDAILNSSPVSTCVDIGHLWKGGLDPVPILKRRLERTRVVHIHGISGRDHKSVSLVPRADLDPVIEHLLEGYHGIVTIEVFSEGDFASSMASIRSSMERLGHQS